MPIAAPSTNVPGDVQAEEIAPILKANEQDIREAHEALRPVEPEQPPTLIKKES